MMPFRLVYHHSALPGACPIDVIQKREDRVAEDRRLLDIRDMARARDLDKAGCFDRGVHLPGIFRRRAEILAALACVDAAVIFDEDTPHEIVAALQPDVLVKGADWAPGTIVGADTVEARGGRVVRIPMIEGYSTTRLIEKVRAKA